MCVCVCVCVCRGETEDDKYCHFYILWALKESYVKAIGLGLGFDLRNVSNGGREGEREGVLAMEF